MSLETTTTPEGLRVYVDTMPDRQITKVNAFVGVGSVYESEKRAGLSHALEHIVLRGTDAFPTGIAIEEFDGMNAMSTNAFTSYNHTYYEATGPFVDPILKRMGEVLFRATFIPEYVRNELSTINREIYERRQDSELLHFTAADYALFGKPYGRSIGGYADQVNYSPEQLQKFYKRHYVMSNMALVAVGNVRMEEVLQDVENYFDHSSTEKPIVKKTVPKQPKTMTTGLLMEGYETANVRVATPMDQDFVKRYLENKLQYETAMQALGDLCFKRFRLDTGISYDGSAFIYTGNDPLAWSVAGNATVDPSKVKKTKAMFADILSRSSDTYSGTAISSAIGRMKGETLRQIDSVEQRADLYLDDLADEIEPVDASKAAEAAKNLSQESVRAAIDDIAEYFGAHPPITHVTGPQKALKSVDKVFDIDKIA